MEGSNDKMVSEPSQVKKVSSIPQLKSLSNLQEKKSFPKIVLKKKWSRDIKFDPLEYQEKENFPEGKPRASKKRKRKEENLSSLTGKSEENSEDRNEQALLKNNSKRAANNSLFNVKLKMLQKYSSKKESYEDLNSTITSLSPELKDLVLKPRSEKIRRPPNSFMIFAKIKRNQIKSENPEMSNKEISTVLGDTWRDMPQDERMEYYRQSLALEKLHRETYPDYIYNPTVARLRKEKKTAKITPKKSNKKDENKSCNSNKTPTKVEHSPGLQENNKDETEKGEIGKFYNEFQAKMNINPMFSPVYDPRLYKMNPFCDNRAHFRDTFYNPLHYQQKFDPKYTPVKDLCQPGSKESETLDAAKVGTPYHSSKIFPNNFHPAVWNPWLMWPGIYHHPPTPRPFPMSCVNRFPSAAMGQYQDQQSVSPKCLFQDKTLHQSTTPNKDQSHLYSLPTNQNVAIIQQDVKESKDTDSGLEKTPQDESDESNSLIIMDENSDVSLYIKNLTTNQ